MTRRLSLDRWFSLPRLGKDTFSDLMKARVKYDTKFGFMLTSSTDTTRALSILSSALDEEVALASACFICDKPFEGNETSEGKELTLCQDCLRNEDAFSLYKMKFANLMESL